MNKNAIYKQALADDYISIGEAMKSLDTLEKTAYHNSALFPDHVSECREELLDVPAADVRPVVRGEWVDVTWCGEDYIQCNICGYGALFHEKTNFCPNCGADMRGEAK